jgi:sRNA-binding carbon storage regulator CsrA
MPRVSRRNPRADSSVDESPPPKKPSQHTAAKKPSSPSSKGTKAKAKAPPEGPHPKNSTTAATTGVATPQKRRGKEIVTLPSPRKSARLGIDATHHTKRLRAIEDQSVIDEVIEIHSPVAAAASTVLYSLQYGDSGEYGDDSAGSIESPSGKADCNEDDDYTLGGLIFSDDEDFLVDVDSESEDERLRSSFPKDRSRKTIIPGGPQPPDLSNYPESEHSSVMGKYVKARKKFVDDERHRRLKTQKSTTKGGGHLSGDQTEQLRPMAEVEKSRLSAGNIFRSKDVVKLRIAEEANLRGISTRVQRSDVMNLTVVGINFYVHATVYENVGWCIHAAVCRECDDVLKIPPRDKVDLSVLVAKKGYVRIPIKAKMIVPIIREAVADNPGISYQSIQHASN